MKTVAAKHHIHIIMEKKDMPVENNRPNFSEHGSFIWLIVCSTTRVNNADNLYTFSHHVILKSILVNDTTSNSNWTEWSTIQGVIGRVISNRPSAKREADLKLRAQLLPELYNTKSNY